MKKGDANWYLVSLIIVVLLILFAWLVFFSENGLGKIFG